MDKYIRLLDFDFYSNQQILQLISHIDSFKGQWNLVQISENRYLAELRKIATIESIGSSTRIEGATLTDEEIEELLKNIKIQKLDNRDEQEVLGYYDALEIIIDNYNTINLSVNYVKQLHKILLKYSNKDERHRGNYKNLSNKVVANYPTGEQKTIFNTTSPEFVDIEMSELIDWVNLQFKNKIIHPLIVIGILIYEFLSIHPFQDGNGRLSRLVTTLSLLKLNYTFIQYISFENHIEKNKKKYYEALMSSQRKRGTKNEKIDKWLIFFLNSLKQLTINLENKYDLFKTKGGYLNERQKEIRDFIIKNQPIKMSDLKVNFNNIPQGTLKSDLKYLKHEKIVLMIGKGKGSFYILNEENA